MHVVVPLDGRPSTASAPAGSPAPSAAWRPTGGSATLRLATASCQHFETGFYAAHRDLAEWAPDLVVFLGDFIYEGAGAGPTRRRPVREHDGAEATDLAGYRARYEQYLGDADLRRRGPPARGS